MVLAILGVGLGVVALLLDFTESGRPTTIRALPAAGAMAAGLVLGVPLAFQARAGWRGRSSRPFSPSRSWLVTLWIVLVLLVGLGAVVAALSLAPDLLLAPIHAVTMSLLPLIVLGWVGWALQGTVGTWRDVVVSLASGGSLGAGISLAGEAVVALALVAVAVIAASLTPGGMQELITLAEQLRDPAWLADPTKLSELLLSPAVAIPVLLLLSVPVPMVEEAFKPLAAGVAGRWIQPRSARAFLWGVASGAGFALVENLLNGALGGVESWPLMAVARFGATAVHCFTGGLVGWGWGQLWTGQRPWRLLGSYVVAVAIHGLWNAAGVGVALLSVGTVGLQGNGAGSTISVVGMAALVGTLGMVVVASLLGLVLVGRRLSRERETASDRAEAPENLEVGLGKDSTSGDS